jgi:hypothetical protein
MEAILFRKPLGRAELPAPTVAPAPEARPRRRVFRDLTALDAEAPAPPAVEQTKPERAKLPPRLLRPPPAAEVPTAPAQGAARFCIAVRAVQASRDVQFYVEADDIESAVVRSLARIGDHLRRTHPGASWTIRSVRLADPELQ